MEWARKERVGLGDTVIERMTEIEISERRRFVGIIPGNQQFRTSKQRYLNANENAGSDITSLRSPLISQHALQVPFHNFDALIE